MSEEKLYRRIDEVIYKDFQTVDVVNLVNGCMNTLDYILTDPGSDSDNRYPSLIYSEHGVVWLPIRVHDHSARILVKGRISLAYDNHNNPSSSYHGLYDIMLDMQKKLQAHINQDGDLNDKNYITQDDLDHLVAINNTVRKLRMTPYAYDFSLQDEGLHYLMTPSVPETLPDMR